MSLTGIHTATVTRNGRSAGGMEKYSNYFASISPLNAKIYSDFQAVQQNDNFTGELSYNEKCALLDKHLIHDRIHRPPNQNNLVFIEQPIYGNMTTVQNHNLRSESPSASGGNKRHQHQQQVVPNQNNQAQYQDHYSQLMLNIYPKKPSRMIYDEQEDIYFIDEHSEPFNFTTQSQVDFCELGEFVKSLPVPPHEILQAQQQVKNEHGKKLESFTAEIQKAHRQAELRKEAAAEEKTRRARAFGVPIPIPSIPNLRALKPLRKKPAPTPPPRSSESQYKPKFPAPAPLADEPTTGTSTNMMVVEKQIIPVVKPVAPLPPAKPRRSSTSSTSSVTNSSISSSSVSVSDNETNLPNQIQNIDLIAELQAKLKGKTSSNAEKTSTSNSTSVNGHHQSKPLPPPVPIKKPNKVKPRAPPPPPPRRPSNASDKDLETTRAKYREEPIEMSELERKFSAIVKDFPKDEDFKVDISSPCKIATPKTGLDFLDNW